MGLWQWHLGKGRMLFINAIHQSGKWYTNDNIDQMFMLRRMSRKKSMIAKGSQRM
jgi:hypothetical protein